MVGPWWALTWPADLEATHSQVVLIAGVPREAEHGEGDRGGGQAGQSQLPLAGVSLLEERRQLQNCDLEEGERETETEHSSFYTFQKDPSLQMTSLLMEVRS